LNSTALCKLLVLYKHQVNHYRNFSLLAFGGYSPQLIIYSGLSTLKWNKLI
jgi:hypothetical protein